MRELFIGKPHRIEHEKHMGDVSFRKLPGPFVVPGNGNINLTHFFEFSLGVFLPIGALRNFYKSLKLPASRKRDKEATHENAIHDAPGHLHNLWAHSATIKTNRRSRNKTQTHLCRVVEFIKGR